MYFGDPKSEAFRAAFDITFGIMAAVGTGLLITFFVVLVVAALVFVFSFLYALWKRGNR